MTILTIDAVTPGLTVTKEVRDLSGRLLLGVGETIQEKHLRAFRMWGVSQVEVMGPGQEEQVLDAPEALDPARLAEAEKEARDHFLHNDPRHHLVEALFARHVQILYQRLGEKETA